MRPHDPEAHAATMAAYTRKPLLTRIGLAIVLAPFGIGFLIAASLSGGVKEVYKALAGRD